VNRKKETITLSIPAGTKENLEALASRFQIFWGKSPSPSGLIAAIATGEIELGQPFSLSTKQTDALQKAITSLVRSGAIEDAQTLSNLLLERGNLPMSERWQLSEQVSQYDRDWRLTVNRYIQDQQPFRVMYVNSQGKALEFTIKYAEIAFREKRFYLEIWCEETDDLTETDRQNFPEIVHNRCLRFDRIQGIIPIEGQWRNGLDHIQVQLQFRGDLLKAYEPKPRDIKDETLDKIRVITRKVSNPFWLVREVLAYGDHCIVLTPEPLRQLIRQNLLKTIQQYD
jgi:predicted DNA-binding transcriptional regulator YafY